MSSRNITIKEFGEAIEPVIDAISALQKHDADALLESRLLARAEAVETQVRNYCSDLAHQRSVVVADTTKEVPPWLTT